MNEHGELRRAIRERLASGRLRRDRPRMPQTPPADRVSMIITTAQGAPCDACDGRDGPVVAYRYDDGALMRFHPACEEIWEEERHRPTTLSEFGWPPVFGGSYRGAERLPTPGVGTLKSVTRVPDGGSLRIVVVQGEKEYHEEYQPPAALLEGVEALLRRHMGTDINDLARLPLP